MSNAMLDIDRYLAERSDAELTSLATKVVKCLMDRHAEQPESLALKDEAHTVAYVVVPFRPAYTLKTEEEFLTEAERRAKAPDRRFLSAEEFLAKFGE